LPAPAYNHSVPQWGLTLCKFKIEANILKKKNPAAKGPSRSNVPTNRDPLPLSPLT